jgi:hypothetical protein
MQDLSGSHRPHSSLWEAAKTTYEHHLDTYELSRPGKPRRKLLMAGAANRIRLQERKPGKGSISLT